jgi:hypothetical protein
MSVDSTVQAIREMVEDEEDGDETISSLPANNLRGTFVAAYDVLTRILTEITWDELLGYRSKVWYGIVLYGAQRCAGLSVHSHPV